MLYSLLLAALSATAPLPDTPRADHDIRLVGLRHAGEIQRCYEAQGLRINPALRGTIEVELIVLPTGRVDDARISYSRLAGAGRHEVESCVVAAVRNWRFDRGSYGVEAIVYPFRLDRGAPPIRTAWIRPRSDRAGTRRA